MKTILSFLTVLLLSNVIIAQNTAIPDANFEQELIDLGYDTGIPNGVIPTANINTVTILSINNPSINDLTGIEGFTALTELHCNSNQLISLDITQNTALTILFCEFNQLTSLDVTQNTALTELYCGNNQLASLDVTQNTALIHLTCTTNVITSLDLSQNTSLTELYCDDNKLASLDLSLNTALIRLNCSTNELTHLDVSQNSALTLISCHDNSLTCLNIKNGNNTNLVPHWFESDNNPSLTCIEVDDVTWANANLTDIDPASSFSTNCPPCSTVGLNEHNLSNFNIYPNPALNQLTIETELAISNVSIVDITGRTVTTINHSTKLIDVSDLTNGVYFLKIINEEGIITEKFIKK